MILQTDKWKEFLLKSICDISNGNKFDNDKMNYENPSVNFVSRTANNNGVSDYVDLIDGVAPYPAGTLSVALGGSIGSCYLQTKPFYTGQNVGVLSFDESISDSAKLFIANLFMNECKYKFVAFGRELNKHMKSDFSLYLPIKLDKNNEPVIDESKKYSDEGFVPDWQFMEDYIKSLHHEPISTQRANEKKINLDVDKWEDFLLNNLFNIKKGKRLTSSDQEEGSNNYVGAIDSNNGIANHIGQKPIHKGNTITLSYNGSVGEVFYQKDDYWATDDVNALYPKFNNFNCKIGLFFATVIRQEKYKYTYGRKWTLEKMNSTIIKLPIQRDEQGKPVVDDENKYHPNGFIPDWKFMEDYINSLPYSDRI